MGRRFVDMRTIATRMQFKDARVNQALAQQRRADAMTTQAIATTSAPRELPSPEVISKVLLGGDLSQLSPQQRISYYRAVCDSLGLNPLTKPFEFLRLSGKEVLYALRNATDQLRNLYGISVQITAREVLEDTYVVTARATLPNGRHDESIGAVPIATLKGESRSNAMMKCETKAKRRVTLSLVGLSTLDESEVDSIPHAAPMHFNPEQGTIDPPASAPPAARALVEPGLGVPAAPADQNAAIPEAWKPFVRTEARTGTIVGGKQNRTTGKTTITLETNLSGGPIECWTTDREVAKAVTGYKDKQTPVTITMTEGHEIVTLAEATDAAF